MSMASNKIKMSMVAALAVVLLAGCGSNNSNNAGESSSPATGEGGGTSSAPVEVTMMSPYFYKTAPTHGEVLDGIEKLTNAKITINWVPGGSVYWDKLNVTIASNDLAKVVTGPHPATAQGSVIASAIDSGMFWEIGPYLKDYPNLSRINAQVLENASYKGKLFGLPRNGVLSRNGMIIRKDWLDKLGLEVPQTVEEIEKVAMAFATQDPDGNGKADTIGFATSKSFNGFNEAAVWFGAPNGWGELDGKLAPTYLFPEYLDTLKYFHRLYEAGAINKDFLMIDENQAKDLVYQGKAGLYSNLIEPGLMTTMLQSFPKGSEFVNIGAPEGPDGRRTQSDPGYTLLHYFPKSSVKTEDELKQILGVFDKWSTKEAQNLTHYGIEGKHYELVDGEVHYLDFQALKNETNQNGGLGGDLILKDMLYPEHYNTELEKHGLELQKEDEQYAIANPAWTLVSETYSKLSGTLDPIIEDARNMFVLGELDEAGWNKELEHWRKAGGDKVIEEMNAATGK
ncbi:extracellular solute-binding protein [Paenibacillus sp. HB172176]|uniref:extracellular solute-binding protein n=1 Tax=Paenibacillus sp. HB172176 TaxID=2493690 RepID=UPI00143C3ADB|nr:extracellular solute-binding protein [Paenibacillus sp. HB172176]